LLRTFCDQFIERRPYISITPGLLLLGYENKLWFLPFVFLAGAAGFPIATVVSRNRSASRIAESVCVLLGVAVGLLAAVESPSPTSGALAIFGRRVMRVLPCTLWGLAAGLRSDIHGRDRTGSPRILAVALLTLAACLTWSWINPDSFTILTRAVGGMCLMLCGLNLPNRLVRPGVAKMAAYSFGIYLLHPMVAGCLIIPLHRLRFAHGLVLQCFVSVATLIIILAFMTLAQRSRWTAWLVPSSSEAKKAGARSVNVRNSLVAAHA
jgi:peptidoglycan/LPS O-acetylase OafA/YrhL